MYPSNQHWSSFINLNVGKNHSLISLSRISFSQIQILHTTEAKSEPEYSKILVGSM